MRALTAGRAGLLARGGPGRKAAVLALLLIAETAFAGVDPDGNTVAGPTPGNRPASAAEVAEVQPLAAVPVQVIFSDQASFLAASGAPLLEEGFESTPLAAGVDFSEGGVERLEFTDFVATSQPDLPAMKVLCRCQEGDINLRRAETNGNHNTTPGGTKWLAADTDMGLDEFGGGSADVTLIFDFPIVEFGAFLIDLDQNTADMQVTVNGEVFQIPNHGDSGESYFGIISDTPFTTVEIVDPSRLESFYSLDDVAYVVPEPTAVALQAAALAALLALRSVRAGRPTRASFRDR